MTHLLAKIPKKILLSILIGMFVPNRILPGRPMATLELALLERAFAPVLRYCGRIS
jgi:hypothetical protein